MTESIVLENKHIQNSVVIKKEMNSGNVYNIYTEATKDTYQDQEPTRTFDSLEEARGFLNGVAWTIWKALVGR